MTKNYQKSFTLTEVLIVTSIIAIFTSFVFIAMSGTRAGSRDSKRVAEVDSIRTALEYYYYDNKEYPESLNWIKIEEDEDTNGPFTQVMKNPQYLPIIPRDPLYGKVTEAEVPYSYQYQSTEDKKGYKIHVELEKGGSYEVYAAGGKGLVYGGIGPGPSITVGTTSSDEGLLGPRHWKSFYANGRYWVWYCTNGNWGYRSSTDGSSWSNFATVSGCWNTEGWHCSVFFDGTYVHWQRNNLTSGFDLFYQRGIPNSDGSITWSAGTQTVHNGSLFNRHDEGTIAVDSNGYAFIWDKHYSSNTPYAWKNATNTGVWITDTGFPYKLNTGTTEWRGLIVPLTNGKMYAVYAVENQVIRGRLWNGSNWEAEETNVADYNLASVPEWGGALSATAMGDDVYFAYLRASTPQVRFNKRVYGTGWQTSDELVQDSVTNRSAPVITMDTSTGDSYVFWAGSPAANHIYYKRRMSWGAWDSNPVDWVDESTDGLTRNDSITGYFKKYGSRIGLVYLTGSSSPYDIKFKSF
ncbi:hypothetical protein AMJ50_01065 [Parcubacteria bacterium DG_74_3]|nr:MAG: hypothetical protein AMJ50_01065 [Parcubacteria bacterium DG_74_3]